MFWVLTLVAVRSVRGTRREEASLQEIVIFEEDEHLLPPQYVDEPATVADVKEKN